MNSSTALDTSPLLQSVLAGRSIVLGVTGGIAIYKSCHLARLLTKLGAKVSVVMSHSAKKMIAPEVFSALTGQAVWFDQWEQNRAGMMAHINLSREADIILVAPATAGSLAKLSGGLADDLLSTLLLGKPIHQPLMVAPAMNKEMWASPATRANIQLLTNRGIHVIPPDSGILACGEEGEGRMPDPEMLVWLLARTLQAQSAIGKKWQGQSVVITLGPTFEPLDPVRGITNISSGAMGLSLTKALWLAGAKVTVIAGGGINGFLPHTHSHLQWINTTTAGDMYSAVMQVINSAPISAYISVAAVADYRADTVSAQKVKKKSEALTLSLTKNPDILSEVSALKTNRPKLVVGFAAESEKVVEYATDKLIRKNLDAIIANDVAHAFGKTTNEGYLIRPHTPALPLPTRHKEMMALEILAQL